MWRVQLSAEANFSRPTCPCFICSPCQPSQNTAPHLDGNLQPLEPQAKVKPLILSIGKELNRGWPSIGKFQSLPLNWMQPLNDWHRSSERQSVKNTSCSKTQRVKHFFQKRKERHNKESDEGQFHHRDVERFYQREFVIKGFVWDAVIYEENCENRRLATEESTHTRQNFSQLNSLETFREKSAFRIRSRAQRDTKKKRA